MSSHRDEKNQKFLASLGQPVDPQGDRSRPGGFLGALEFISSGERFLDTVLPGDPGTAIGENIQKVPLAGGLLRTGFDVAASPLTLATAGFGAQAAAGLRGAGAVGKVAANLVAPVVNSTAKTGVRRVGERLLATSLAGVGASAAATAADEAGLPLPLQMGAGLAGGVFGVGAFRAGQGSVRQIKTGVRQTAEQVSADLASDDPVRRIRGAINSGQIETNLRAGELLSQRRARVSQFRKSAGTTFEGRREAFKRTMAGEFELRAKFNLPDGVEISADDFAAVNARIAAWGIATGKDFKEFRAGNAFLDIFNGTIPVENELKELGEILGRDVVSGLLDKQKTMGARTFSELMAVLNVPRALASSWDASAPFRQGALLWSRKSFWTSFKPMVKAMVKDEWAQQIDDTVKHDPVIANAIENYGLDLTDLSGAAERSALEEAYMSNLASQLPGIRMSERGFVTFLNKLRADTFKSVTKHWDPEKATHEDYVKLAQWVNTATGRGQGLPNSALAANVFFSPRLLWSRLQVMNPKTYADATPLVRREMARDLVAFFGTGAAVAGLAGLTGFADVEISPKSSDFGKMRFGDTRIDTWAGFQPLARYMAQFVTGERKSSLGGTSEVARAVTLGNFARSKLAPATGLGLDVLMGSNFIGEEVDVTTEGGLGRAAAERLLPLFVQDLGQAIMVDGWQGGFKTLPAGVGFGALTYQSTASIRAAGADELFGRKWADLTAQEKAQVNEAYAPELAKQRAPDGDSYAAFKDSTDVETRAKEQGAVAALRAGKINAKDFNRYMVDTLHERTVALQAVGRAAGIIKDDETVLDRYYALYDDATVAGVVDYELLDQLQATFLSTLTEREREVVAERTAFSHAPETDWYFAAKKTISGSGYWDTTKDALDQLRPLVQAVAGKDVTYQQLLVMARTADPRQQLALAGVLKRVDKVQAMTRKQMRRQNPALDAALQAVYGVQPVYGPRTFTR